MCPLVLSQGASLKFSVFQISRRGAREINEDRMGYCYTRASALFVLADGMGGHPKGEVAAQLALQTVSERYQKQALPVLKEPGTFLGTALLAAHHAIIRYASDQGLDDAPRTTLVAVVVQQGRAWWTHCGDSRMYLVRDGSLLMRTLDHSYVDHPNAAAYATKTAPANRNILFTCLGSPIKPVYDMGGPVVLSQGDKILLCSDGLWGCLPERLLIQELSSQPVSSAVPELVEQALRASGGHADNVTAIAMHWESPSATATEHDISTDSVSEGGFASTIEAGLLDTLVEDMDEAAIERSIAEINDAIRRTTTRKT